MRRNSAGRLRCPALLLSPAVTALALTACAGIPTVPATTVPPASDLKLPATAFPAVIEVSTRALGVDEEPEAGEAISPETAALRRGGLKSAAQYRYVIGGERPGRFKVRVDVFHDEATAAEQFRGRHLPQALAMTEPFAAGDDSFIYEDVYAGFRVGTVTVEIRADGATGQLRDFARTYADFVATRLREGSPPATNPRRQIP